jgi:catechol 2,3-dioxygenase-like lactoylglutathione lyase family enzyme
MLTGIDHLVIAVNDLEAARKSYTDLGFTVVAGGRHTGIGTHNALIAFEDGSYLELIAFYEPRPDHRWWVPLQKGGGLVDYCMQTESLVADGEALRRAGVSIGQPEARNRRRPDGYEVRWRFSLPQGDQRGVAPFIIEDETPRDERVPRERRHANGVTGIATLTVAVADTVPVRRWYSAVAPPGTDIRRDDLDATGLRLRIGPHTLDFVQPVGTTGPLAGWLAGRGASPYAATFKTSAPPRALDQSQTLGARLSLVKGDGR